MNTPDILEATLPVVEAFERLGVAYYVGGSVASSAYGMARATLDVDLVADLRLDHIRPLVKMLSASYYIDENMARLAIRKKASFNVIHLSTMLKVDIFTLKDRPYDRESFQRRRKDTIDEKQDAVTLYLASPEDIILNKLEWYKLGDKVSERQWGDVLGVLKVQTDRLDLEYMRYWAADISISDLLERALGEAGITID